MARPEGSNGRGVAVTGAAASSVLVLMCAFSRYGAFAAIDPGSLPALTLRERRRQKRQLRTY